MRRRVMWKEVKSDLSSVTIWVPQQEAKKTLISPKRNSATPTVADEVDKEVETKLRNSKHGYDYEADERYKMQCLL